MFLLDYINLVLENKPNKSFEKITKETKELIKKENIIILINNKKIEMV